MIRGGIQLAGILLALFISSMAWAQSQPAVIQGFIADSHGEPLPYSSVAVKNQSQGVAADEEGRFSLRLQQSGRITLVIQSIGYESREVELSLSPGKTYTVNEQLAEDQVALNEVMVSGKSKTTLLREQAFTIAAIDAQPLKIQNLDVNQVLGRISGVRIRETGGLGSSMSFSLNGFTGKQVKFFLDGIPMDHFGSSLSLNNIPVNMISGIEVYKGVVPIHLGSDALGGAVNITTQQDVKDYLNASYSFGSFNTHRASFLGGVHFPKSDLFLKTSLFFNYSDNNYMMHDMEVIRAGNTTGKPELLDVRRFHDAYQSQAGTVELGVSDKAFADQLSLAITLSSNDNEIQHGYNLTKVFGEVRDEEQLVMPVLKYKKQDLFIEGLDVTANAMMLNRQLTNIDTASVEYNWLGETIERIDANHGEFSYYKTSLTYDDWVTQSSVNFNYAISPVQSVSLNNSYHYFSRQGENPLVDREFTPFYKPNTIAKNISAAAYQFSLFQQKLKTVVFYKLFAIQYHTVIEDEETEDYTLEYDESQLKNGYGVASTFHFNDWSQVKVSYEHTYRLPDGEEIFGNGLTIKPNTELKPESSNNLNAGFIVSKRSNEHLFRLEGGYLYRTAKDYIRQDASNPVNSNYINEEAVKLKSVEINAQYHYKQLINFSGSVTRQHNTNNNKNDHLYGDQLPNQPTLFANANLGFQFDNVGLDRSRLSISWNTLFVDEFYWKWPSQGNARSKFTIPRQLLHDLSVSYQLDDGRYNISLACTNLTDNLAYDNFNMQKPGRAFNIKLSYFLDK
ncbi:TonB-dependent receptor [Sunxiuqinia indica]|uniref:TonB-dependent receptor n=1 Tax=Sunxiuqinia indica TaxID=2692584 RepID=UPI001358261A|nr:TonB-dependent receptor [Sunxiuqinia indica]